MGTTKRTQLAVIGAGPGGYVAAFHAADLGLDVTLINAEPKPGGVCLQRGCIPSKALLHVARLLLEAREAEDWGVRFERPKVDLERLRSWKNDVIAKLSSGIEVLAERRGVRLLRARARFESPTALRLEPLPGEEDCPERLEFQSAIIACGSEPAVPPVFKLDDPRVMDSTGALELEEIPERLLVIGGGYIGLEMGTVYAALGSKVTVVELTGSLLPGVDADLVRPLAKRLEGLFSAIHLKTKVEGLRAESGGIVALLGGEDVPAEMRFDRVLVAVGRRPRAEGLGLEAAGVQVDARGFVPVDAERRTSQRHIFAIGDVAGEPMLAHKASREGKVAAEAAAGKKAAYDNVAVPAVVFTDPEVAWCGLTESEARAHGREVEVARFPWTASGRALTLGRTEGLTKLIVEPKTQRILGVGIVGVGAGELIAEGTLAVEMAAVVRDVADTIHAHPTLSETLAEAAEAVLGQATHLVQPRR